MVCTHHEVTKVIDQLGLMRERNGVLGAPVLRWHYACTSCGHIISTHVAADPDEEVEDPIGYAFNRLGNAYRVTRDWLRE